MSQFGDLVFQTRIRRCVALRESPAVGQCVFRYAPRSNGSEDYAALAIEVISRLEVLSKSQPEEVAHV